MNYKLIAVDMVVKIQDTDEDELISKYRCFHCQDVKGSKTQDCNATDYYKKVLAELDEYKRKHSKNDIWYKTLISKSKTNKTI